MYPMEAFIYFDPMMYPQCELACVSENSAFEQAFKKVRRLVSRLRKRAFKARADADINTQINAR